MFEVNETYANRKGKYVVLELTPPKMKVRFEDGEICSLNIGIQERIWLNIRADEERKPAFRQEVGENHQVFIYSLSSDDIALIRADDRIAHFPEETEALGIGARIIYYDSEQKMFCAASTITGDEITPDHDQYIYLKEGREMHQYPIEVDVLAIKPELRLPLATVEIESLPNYKKVLQSTDKMFVVTEDDFESLADALVELVEDLELDDDSNSEEDGELDD